MITRRDGLDFTGESSEIAGAKRHQVQRDSITVDRLIVLIPNRGINYSALAKRILALAKPCQIKVLLIGLSAPRATEEAEIRMRLTTLTSMMCDVDVHTDTCIEPGDDWVRAVHKFWQPGDAVICLAEQVIKLNNGVGNPLYEVIEYLLGVPVYVVAGMFVPQRIHRHQTAIPAGKAVLRLDNLLLITVILGLFLLQVRINLTTVGIVRNGLLCASSLAEVGLMSAWSGFSH
jgi:hypothetical protein